MRSNIQNHNLSLEETVDDELIILSMSRTEPGCSFFFFLKKKYLMSLYKGCQNLQLQGFYLIFDFVFVHLH